MLCPHCTTATREITKSGVLIDVCPDCKGTWLDRGELEKILNRAREVEQEWEEERSRSARPSRDYDDASNSRKGLNSRKEAKNAGGFS